MLGRGTTRLQAASHGFVSFAQWLLNRCVDLDINALTLDGSSALHLAAANGHLPVVQVGVRAWVAVAAVEGVQGAGCVCVCVHGGCGARVLVLAP